MVYLSINGVSVDVPAGSFSYFLFLFLFFPIFCRKSIKLYSDFYSSDVIVASPVRLIAVSIYSFDFFF